MCPVCIAMAALFATKASIAGAVAVVAVRNLFVNNSENQIPAPIPPKEDHHD